MDIGDPRLQKFFDEWSTKRQAGQCLPALHDIDPAILYDMFGWLLLIDVLDKPQRFWVRHQGAEIADRAGYDLTDKHVDEIPVPDYREHAIRQCKKVVASGEPLHLHYSRVLDGRPRSYEALWLPLSDDRSRVTMLACGLIYDSLYGAIAPIGVTLRRARSSST